MATNAVAPAPAPERAPPRPEPRREPPKAEAREPPPLPAESHRGKHVDKHA